MSAMRPFLTARWQHLAMLNYEVPPELLRDRVPRGTELDSYDGRTYVSVVGFMFLQTRVKGWRIPFHRDFEEVNLRFYVRRKGEEGWRRGVVFVKEIVPKAAIAWIARVFYGENYISCAMSHRWSEDDPPCVRYAWRSGGRDMSLELEPEGSFRPISEGSEEEFIAEHYWGYAAQRNGGAMEYRVEHPRWRIATARRSAWNGDASELYGSAFAEILNQSPRTAFLAEGSEVVVQEGNAL